MELCAVVELTLAIAAYFVVALVLAGAVIALRDPDVPEDVIAACLFWPALLLLVVSYHVAKKAKKA